MTRIISKAGATDAPQIDRHAVETFFAERARKHGELGSIRTVIYQDRSGTLAERRDAAEKRKLLPLLDLADSDRVLDVACGTGRWTEAVLPLAGYYHGYDFCRELLAIARSRFEAFDNLKFTHVAVEDVSLQRLGEVAGFNKILAMGVLIYLNDGEMHRALRNVAMCASEHCRLLLREPVGVQARLTIKEHFSEDMQQYYNAIYRTEAELMDAFDAQLFSAGFRLQAVGDVYDDDGLNNRPDTRQRWYLIER